MRILVTGSRFWDDWPLIRDALIEVWNEFGRPDDVTVVHGGAMGADTIADVEATLNGWRVEVHPAKWSLFGKKAGILRNVEMVDSGADICLAFIKDNSRGATHCASYAESKGTPVRRYRVEDAA